MAWCSDELQEHAHPQSANDVDVSHGASQHALAHGSEETLFNLVGSLTHNERIEALQKRKAPSLAANEEPRQPATLAPGVTEVIDDLTVD